MQILKNWFCRNIEKNSKNFQGLLSVKVNRQSLMCSVPIKYPSMHYIEASRSFSDPAVPKLVLQLSSQIQNRSKRFPIPPYETVRFTETELTRLLRLTKLFIKHQIEIKNLGQYIWAHYQVIKGDYNNLTRAIWIKAFSNSQVLEPLEDLEMRFQLRSGDRVNMEVVQIRRALKGCVNLEREDQRVIAPKAQLGAAPLHVHYVAGETQIINKVVQTQAKENQWSSHLDESLSVYVNYKVKEKK